MYFILVLLTLSINSIECEETIVCNGTIFNHVYFEKEVLFDKYEKPYSLVFHKYSGILFFSHTYKMGMHADFAIKACQFHNRTCIDVKGIDGGYAIAYDVMNDDIYMGGHDGIYTYNFLSKKAEFFDEKGKSIWGLCVHKNFYYIGYPDQKLYVYKDNGFVEVAEAIGIEIDQFYVSRADDIYFYNKTALFKVERPSKYTIVLSEVVTVKQIAEDTFGEIYFACIDGIYLEDKTLNRITKIADLDEGYGMTFDQDDKIIYSDRNTIYRLQPSNHSEACYNAIMDVSRRSHFPAPNVISREEQEEQRRFSNEQLS